MAEKAQAVTQSKNQAINKMIVVLALATVVFNTSYLICFYLQDQLGELASLMNFSRIVVLREINIIFILIKFSVTGLLFFVSGEIFRANLYAICKKVWRLIRCSNQ